VADGTYREFTVEPAYDRRTEGYGQHCAEMRWVVKGQSGAIQFLLYTGWYPGMIPKTSWTDWSDWASLRVEKKSGCHDAPMPADLGYHSPTPRYEGQDRMSDECHILGGPCYYDGSGLNAAKPFSILIHEGGEKLWEFLEAYYHETFPEVNRG